MATYAELDPTDKAIVDNTANLIRSAAGRVARGWNELKGIADDLNAVNLILSLDAEEVIPNASGLAGADNLTRAELVGVFAILNAIRTANDNTENRAALSKAAGINAMVRE